MEALFHLLSPVLKFTGVSIENPHQAFVPTGITAFIGPSGAGKSSLANILEKGRNFMTNRVVSPLGEHPKMRTIVFNDIHSLSGFHVEYYQQRFESTMNDDVPTVAEILGDLISSHSLVEMIKALNIEDIMYKRINYLSSGQLRKLLIVRQLVDLPQILILDNPFIGLDAPSRAVVDSLIHDISLQGIHVITLVSDPDDLPQCVDAVLPITKMIIGKTIMRPSGINIEEFRRQFDYLFDFKLDISLLSSIIKPDSRVGELRGKPVVQLRHCHVCYGQHVLIRDISWDIKGGECWSLSGPNGSGKSTLLSLINADNPQAYSNDVSIFGHRRGPGVSIWDIKRNIGFLSSELHLCYRADRRTVYDVISEGFNRAVGLFTPLTVDQCRQVDTWIRLFELDGMRDMCFNNLSAGYQRLVLLLRALVRQPIMLILDEPVHGVDRGIKQAVRQVVDALAFAGTTIIYVTHNADEVPSCITRHKKLG